MNDRMKAACALGIVAWAAALQYDMYKLTQTPEFKEKLGDGSTKVTVFGREIGGGPSSKP